MVMKLKMKHPSDMPKPRFTLRWSNALPTRPRMAHLYRGLLMNNEHRGSFTSAECTYALLKTRTLAL